MTCKKEKAGIVLPAVFNYGTDKKLRAVEINNQPWVLAKDICDALDLANPSNAIMKLDEDERAKKKLGRQGEAWFVNESGLYNLIFRSNKPEAKAFRRWVTNEVLPSLRKTGSFELPNVGKMVHGVGIVEINDRQLLPYRELLEAAGASTAGSAYKRKQKYPGHFVTFNKMVYVSVELGQLIVMYRQVTERRKEVAAMQPILPLNFGEPLVRQAHQPNQIGGRYGM